MSHSAVRQEPVGTVLVCAPRASSEEPLVALAGRSYETDSERVFLDGDGTHEVMRLPLDAPVAVRPLRHFASPSEEGEAEAGELALLRAIGRARNGLGREAAPSKKGVLLAETFASALRAGDADASTHLAALLVRRRGAAGVYRAISECLAELGDAWAQDRGPVLAERAATQAAMSVCDRLRAHLPAPTSRGTIVLATPPGERHTLALGAIAHLLQEAGHPVLVVDDLPLEELAELASEPGTAAVVLSAHVRLPVVAARRLVATLREAAPDVLVAGGGPGFPRTPSVGADLVSEDVTVLLRALEERSSALTTREREVLLAVADGLTNPEIAARLHVSSSTVKTHLDHVLAKTGAEHRAAAVATALRQGWIT
jgi:DNA-binding CsgD family transcriptional regulator/methanogenic corrinoid protein MtbC1